MDATALPLLGPWAAALAMILVEAESQREDRMTEGRKLHCPDPVPDLDEVKILSPLGYMAGSFVVFRGVALEPEVILKWTKMVTKSEYEH